MDQAAGDNGHASSTSGGGEHDGPSPANAVNVEVRRYGQQEVDRKGNGSQDQRKRLGEVQVFSENVRKVVLPDALACRINYESCDGQM